MLILVKHSKKLLADSMVRTPALVGAMA